MKAPERSGTFDGCARPDRPLNVEREVSGIVTLEQLNQAYLDVLNGKLDRRALFALGTSFGLSTASCAALMRTTGVSAQDASLAASPAADLSYRSITAADAQAQLLADFPMSAPAARGGT